MARGYKSGGRKPGTPNKRTAELAERLAELGFDPVAVIVAIASDPGASPELRLRAAAEMMPYCFPRRKAVELTASGDSRGVRVTIHDCNTGKSCGDSEAHGGN